MGGMGEVGGQVFQQHRLILTWHCPTAQVRKCLWVLSNIFSISGTVDSIALPCPHLCIFLHVDITIYREILVIYAHVFQTPASDVNSHMELFQSWIDIVCFSLPAVIVSIKRAKHSRSPAVPRKVIFDCFQLRPGIVTLLVVWKNNKDGKIWRLDVK